ncbi:MAG TPA: hypothetical protein VGS22_04015 [Thermoanaerobaculia bacterium]|jgi:hypothetical protein|nr:hypothetical protein [Thermoanaerobaculia bacterium]
MGETSIPLWRRVLGFSPMPVPPHVFALDAERLRYAHLPRQGDTFRFRSYRQAALAHDTFLAGPLGGPLRDPRSFSDKVGALVRTLKEGGVAVKSASLVVPDGWLRVVFTESGDLPRNAAAIDEVLRWKLRRLVPFRVDDLRLNATEVMPLAGQEEPRRLLLGFAVEALLAQLEEAFSAAGVRLGLITNASLALASALDGPVRGGTAERAELSGLVLADSGSYTLVFRRGGEPVLHRFKAFATSLPDDARSGLVERDLRLTRNFLDEHFPGEPHGQLVLVAPAELEPLWVDLIDQGLGLSAVPLDGRQLPPVRAEETTAPWRELAPLLGAVRMEVS